MTTIVKQRKQPVPKTIYEKFWVEAKTRGLIQERVFNKIPLDQLNPEQKLVVDIVEESLKQKEVLRLLMPGRAGTGKSVVIKTLRGLFEQYKVKFVVLSFTGSSAFLVGGKTIHRTLCLNFAYSKSNPGLNTEFVRSELGNVKYFVFDEFSLIGIALFGYVNERLKAIFRTNEVMGGRSVILAGDWAQLPPVLDKSLFVTGETLRNLEASGAQAYASIKRCVFLKTLMRQGGSEEHIFRDMLGRTRLGQLTPEDEKYYSTRNLQKLTSEEVTKFAETATFLFAERAVANRYNDFRLEQLPTPIVEIKSIDSKVAPSGIVHSLKLKVGARIILTSNLWIEAGGYNGAQGVVTLISSELDTLGQPLFVMVKLDRWYGQCFGLRTKEVPITPLKWPEYDPVSRSSWTRRQFPLQLSWGLTLHKAQGATFERVVLSFPLYPSRDSLYFRISPSAFYVAVSRVRKLEHLCFSTPFRQDLVTGQRSLHGRQWFEEEKRLEAFHEQPVN